MLIGISGRYKRGADKVLAHLNGINHYPTKENGTSLARFRAMGAQRNRLFIAAPAPIIRQLGAAFAADDIEIVGCETWDDAVSHLKEKEADVLVICYAFDEMRPFRLLQYLRQARPRSHVPTVLVRALPVQLGRTQEEQIRESYQNLGVDQFYNLYDEKLREGAEPALRNFRDRVLAKLRRAPEDYSPAERRRQPRDV